MIARLRARSRCSPLAALALAVVPGPAVLYIVAQIDPRRPTGRRRLGARDRKRRRSCTCSPRWSACRRCSPPRRRRSRRSSSPARRTSSSSGSGRCSSADDRIGGRRPEPTPRRASIAQGVVVNVLNPKTALFFLAFLPQFVDPDAADPSRQLALLGAIFVAIALVERPRLGARRRVRPAAVLRRSRRSCGSSATSRGRSSSASARSPRHRRPLAMRDGRQPARRLAAAVDRDRSSSVTSSPVGISASSRSSSSSAPGAAASSRRSTSSVESSTTSSCLNGLREAAAAEVPAVELLQEAARAALAELAHRLADEEDELGDDLLARRLARRRRRRSRAAPRGCPARRGRPSPPRAPVVASTACARAREVMSPEATTGTSTSETSSAVSA